MSVKTFTRGMYDIQALRIQMGQRIVANFKAKLGQAPSQPEKELSTDDLKVINAIRVSYKKFTDGVKTFPRQTTFKGDEVISDYTDLCLMSSYIGMEREEKNHLNFLEKELTNHAIYNEFLLGVKGVGPAMAGVILSEIDISKAKYPSSLWKYAGVDVGDDGKGRSRRKEHQIDVPYKDKDGKDQTRKSITFNPFLKTKLVGVLAGCMLKSASQYRKPYDDYKARLTNHPDHKDKTKGHINNMALRYMIKIFLVDLHRIWRKLEGLPVSTPYSEGKLGLVHGRKAS